MTPESKEDLHSRKSGLFNSFLQFLSSAEGTPSVLGAEDVFSSDHAFIISSSVNWISDREGMSEAGSSEKYELISGTAQAGI